MNLKKTIDELGNNAHLLARNDKWLQRQESSIQEKIDELNEELKSLKLAQEIKRALQQTNKVAIQHILKDDNDNIQDIVIRIIDLPDALSSMQNNNLLDKVNNKMHLLGWGDDGYDIINSAALR